MVIADVKQQCAYPIFSVDNKYLYLFIPPNSIYMHIWKYEDTWNLLIIIKYKVHSCGENVDNSIQLFLETCVYFYAKIYQDKSP